MEFILKKVSDFNTNDQKLKYEKLGFRFRKQRLDFDEGIRWAATDQPPIKLNLETLEELMDFVKEYGWIIIHISDFLCEDGQPRLQIYDDYRE